MTRIEVGLPVPPPGTEFSLEEVVLARVRGIDGTVHPILLDRLRPSLSDLRRKAMKAKRLRGKLLTREEFDWLTERAERMVERMNQERRK